MNMRILSFVMMSLLCGQAVFAEAARTPDAFLAAVRAAFEAKDAKKLRALTWTKGASKEDLAGWDQEYAMELPADGPVETIRLGPLPPDLKPMVLNGKRFDCTYTPAGSVVIAFKSAAATAAASGPSGSSIPCAVIDGGYYLLTTKTTDLGWKGPADTQWSISVTGRGTDKITAVVKYTPAAWIRRRTLKAPIFTW